MPSTSKSLNANSVNQSLVRVGSFWSEHAKNRKTFLSLAGLSYKTRLFDQIETIFNLLLNKNNFRVTNIYHTYTPEEVVYTGDNTFDTDLFFDNTDIPNRFDQGANKLWLVPLKEIEVNKGLGTNIYEIVEPLKILTSEGYELLINSDFIVKNNFVCFYEDPEKLFKDNKFLITNGHRVPRNIYSFPLCVETFNSTSKLKNFSRVSQSLITFKEALAEVSGFKILNDTQKLISVIGNSEETIYTFEKEIIKISYKHEPLKVNKVYTKGTIIGDGIKFYSKKPGKWWRDIDFSGGFSLSDIVNKPGVLVPEGMVDAYVADVDAGSFQGDKAHVRLDLIGNPDVVDEYWDEVAVRETEMGYYLNNITKIGYGDNTFNDTNFSGILERLKNETNEHNREQARQPWYKKEYRNIKKLRENRLINPADPLSEQTDGYTTVNAIDVLFEAILGNIGCVVVVDMSQLGSNKKQLIRFLTKEQPVGACMILMLKHPDMGDQTLLNNFLKEEISAFQAVDADKQSTCSFNSIIVDSFVARIDTI
jgi:hypothetical protein